MLSLSQYGALLRQKRVEVGYRKAEEFISDLLKVGCDISVSALYRMERGEQMPPLDFALASNLLLFGDAFSDALLKHALDQMVLSPWSHPWLAGALKSHGVGQAEPSSDFLKMVEASMADKNYAMMLETESEFDYEIFVNSHTSEEEGLFITITRSEESPYDDPGSYQIRSILDLERSVVNYLKKTNSALSDEEIRRLIRYAANVVEPYVGDYDIR